jgi:Transcriptional regulator containing an amidase domain and an AraC-type DNA-binding HTH domain
MQLLTARYLDWMALKTNLLWIYEGPVPSTGRASVADLKKLRAFERASTVIALDYCAVWLVLKGSAEIAMDGKTLRAKAGQWLFPWQGIRNQRFSPDAELLSVRFQAHWPDGRPLFEEGLGLVLPREKLPHLEKAARDLLEVLRPHLPTSDARHLGGVEFSLKTFFDVKLVLLGFIRHYYDALIDAGLKPSRLGTRDERVLKALSHLDLLPLNVKVREADLAAEVGLGLSQFVRLFNTEVGMTPKHYIEMRRRDTCRRMLINSRIPLKQLANDLGFAHASDFSSWFKRVHGVSPRDFRRNALREDHV